MNKFQFLLHIEDEDELALLPLLRHLCKYLAWTVGTLTSKEISSTILNYKTNLYFTHRQDNN